MLLTKYEQSIYKSPLIVIYNLMLQLRRLALKYSHFGREVY